MQQIIIFLVALVSSYLGMYISGGVSALSIGLLLLFGLPPQTVYSTYLVGCVGSTTGGIQKFWKSGNIPKKFLLPLAICSIFGGFIGSLILFEVPSHLMYKVVGTSMSLLLLLGIWKSHWGAQGFQPTRKQLFWGYTLGFIVSIIGVIFPAGIGVVLYFLYTGVFGMTALQTKGTGRVLGAIWSISLAIPIFWKGEYNLSYILAFALGSFIGAYISSGHVILKGNEFLRKTILFGIGCLAFYFLFFAQK